MLYNILSLTKSNVKTYLTKILIFAAIFLLTITILMAFLSNYNYSYPYTLVSSYVFASYNPLVSDDYKSFYIENIQINITDVCSGSFELLLFISLIIATYDVSIRKRIYGILILIPILFAFNLLRITIIVYGLLNWNLEFVDFLHMILFKLGFFVFFGLFYYIWLYKSSN